MGKTELSFYALYKNSVCYQIFVISRGKVRIKTFRRKYVEVGQGVLGDSVG